MIGLNVSALQAAGELGLVNGPLQSPEQLQPGTSFASLLASMKLESIEVKQDFSGEASLEQLVTQILNAFIELQDSKASSSMLEEGDRNSKNVEKLEALLASLGEALDSEEEVDSFMNHALSLLPLLEAPVSKENVESMSNLLNGLTFQQIGGHEQNNPASSSIELKQAELLDRWIQHPQEFVQFVQKLSAEIQQVQQGSVNPFLNLIPQFKLRVHQVFDQANHQQAIPLEQEDLATAQLPLKNVLSSLARQAESDQGQTKSQAQLQAQIVQSAPASVQAEKHEFGLETRVNQAAVVEKVDVKQELPTARFTKLIEDISFLLKGTIKGKQEHQGTQLRIQLHPEHLGQLDIRITSIQGKISATVYASHALAKEVIDLSLHQLRQTLTQQGINVEKLEVAHSPSDATFTNSGQQGSQQTQQQAKQSSGTVKLVEEIVPQEFDDRHSESTINFTA